MATPLRRSTRTRTSPKLQYEEELENVANKKTPPRKKKETAQSSGSESESDENNNNNEDQDMMEAEEESDGQDGSDNHEEEEDDDRGDGQDDDDDSDADMEEESDDDDDDDDEDYGAPQKKKTRKSPSSSPRKTPSPKNRKTPPQKGGGATKTRKITISKRGGKRSQRSSPSSTNKKKRGGGGGATSKKAQAAIHGALTKLSNLILDEHETTDNSLVAALLASSKPIEGIESIEPRDTLHKSNSLYTPQLEGIARKILQDQELDGADSMHIQLLNLLFRSVGGSVDTIFKPGTDLDELTDDEWGDLMSQVVEVMQKGEDPLLAADIPTTIGPVEYRKIYMEFWYRLGHAVLNHNSQESTQTEFSSNQFQVEMMKDLISRLSELVMVGQPDLRAAATMAIWQLSIACMERTVELEQKLQVGTRQSKASKAQRNKLQAVKHSMDAWKRNKAELDNLIETSTFQGTFVHRYRDSNTQIRVGSLNMLSKIVLLRPDIFLRDKYLKYAGWMVSDKEAAVRIAAFKCLLGPFREMAKKKPTGPKSLAIDVHNMQNVCVKFLNRFVDCTEDSESTEVQELAMELLLNMLQHTFLDSWEDDEGWDQINLKAIDANSTSKARRDALYFVLEQLHVFDTEDDNRSSMSGLVSDKRDAERLASLANWISTRLCDGPISIDKVRVRRADYVVESLREMHEHKHLLVNWAAILRAIRTSSENPQQSSDMSTRKETAKQRILLRMLACSAEKEVSQEGGSGKKRKRESSNESNVEIQESLSRELLKNLPALLPAFQGDVMALRSLTQLPKYLTPSVYSLPSRKNDFTLLIKNMCRLFLESTDETVLDNIAEALATLVDGNHSRVADVRNHVKKLAASLHDRLMELLQAGDPNAKNTSPVRVSPRHKGRSSRHNTPGSNSLTSDGGFSISPEVDTEHSLYLCLLRWRTLLQGCPLNCLFDEKDEDDEAEVVEEFFTAISEAIGKKLRDRKPVFDDDEDSRVDGGTVSATLPEIWKTADAAVHSEVSKSVNESLQILILVLQWKLQETMEERNSLWEIAESKEDEDEREATMKELEDGDVDDEDLSAVQMRNRLVNLLGMCFDQYLPDSEEVQATEEHQEFAISVQSSAGRNASTVRIMCPKEWMEASDPVRRALALTNDSELIGGFARYFTFSESKLLEIVGEGSDITDPTDVVSDLLVPLGRALTANWNEGNRLEAGLALMHITGSGTQASQVVHAMARHIKKVNPARFLEAQMYCLQRAFSEWVENDPNDLDTDRPTEQQMLEYELEMEQHIEKFRFIEQRAAKLSQCLGVGKLSDKRLKPSILRFMQEGVRFAFEVSEELVLGSRLPFLSILSKYSIWVKKNKQQQDALKQCILEKEDELNDHEEFDEVHEDDLAALSAFKTSLGIPESRRNSSQATYTQDENPEPSATATTPSPGRSLSTSSKRQMSTGGRSRYSVSTQNSLPPVYESGEEDDQSPSPQKRRRLLQVESPEGDERMSAVGSIQERIDEGDEKSSMDSSDGENLQQERIDEGDEKSSSGSSGDSGDVKKSKVSSKGGNSQEKDDGSGEISAGSEDEGHNSEVSSES